MTGTEGIQYNDAEEGRRFRPLGERMFCMNGNGLSAEQKERYSRQIRMPEIGEAGQAKLLASKVLIIGAGGLGSPAALYLAAAGVGTVGIADGDRVELSNLQRQILHGSSDIGRAKAASAADAMQRLDPELYAVSYELTADEENLPDLLAEYDFVLDCTDRHETKLLISDACVRAGKPLCTGSVAGFYGQVMTRVPGDGPCYRCIFGNAPAGPALDAKENGVLVAAAGIIGCIMAAEAVKYLTGAGELLTGSLLTCDLSEMRFEKIPMKRDRNCPACGKTNTEAEE